MNRVPAPLTEAPGLLGAESTCCGKRAKPVTEQDRLTSADPQAMLGLLRGNGRAGERKLRLFAVACCRRLEIWLPDQRSWDAVHVAEWCADGNGSEQDLLA